MDLSRHICIKRYTVLSMFIQRLGENRRHSYYKSKFGNCGEFSSKKERILKKISKCRYRDWFKAISFLCRQTKTYVGRYWSATQVDWNLFLVKDQRVSGSLNRELVQPVFTGPLAHYLSGAIYWSISGAGQMLRRFKFAGLETPPVTFHFNADEMFI